MRSKKDLLETGYGSQRSAITKIDTDLGAGTAKAISFSRHGAYSSESGTSSVPEISYVLAHRFCGRAGALVSRNGLVRALHRVKLLSLSAAARHSYLPIFYIFG
jgi:hypothetical protein